MTKQELKDELKKAMLDRDTERTSTLRMVISALGYYEINKGGANYEATEEDVEAVLQKEVKQRRDSIEQFKAGGRNDLVEKETKEVEMLSQFLPKQMDENEIKTIVTETIQATGATSMQDIGKVMGALMPKVKGKADGGLVNKIVRESLT